MRVGIVGLGAAGCRAAMLLATEGVELTLFEARSRVGGRLETISVNQGKGFFEAGGEWIDKDHHRVIHLLRELGMQPESHRAWPGVALFRGERCAESELWSDAKSSEAALDDEAKRLCQGLKEEPWKNTQATELDRQSLSKLLDSNAASPRARWWLEACFRSDEGDDTDQIGLLGWLCGYLHYLGREQGDMSAYRVPSGGQRLCEAMLALSGLKPNTGYILQGVNTEGASVKLYFEQGEFEFDRVILTLPPRCLEKIRFEPALSQSKTQAIHGCQMSRAIKISLEFSERFWEGSGWTGSMLADLTLQQVWDGSRGEAAVLCVYICGEQALQALSTQNPVQKIFEDLQTIIPEAEKYFLRGTLHDWINDPYAQGAFSHLAPGYCLGGMEHIATPVDRVHFAGEHTALWTGFIEGALESAERVVQEVLNA